MTSNRTRECLGRRSPLLKTDIEREPREAPRQRRREILILHSGMRAVHAPHRGRGDSIATAAGGRPANLSGRVGGMRDRSRLMLLFVTSYGVSNGSVQCASRCGSRTPSGTAIHGSFAIHASRSSGARRNARRTRRIVGRGGAWRLRRRRGIGVGGNDTTNEWRSRSSPRRPLKMMFWMNDEGHDRLLQHA